ncbi:MAG TPA: hypothetical protein VF311_12305, partial [Terriglobales bacterium]
SGWSRSGAGEVANEKRTLTRSAVHASYRARNAIGGTLPKQRTNEHGFGRKAASSHRLVIYVTALRLGTQGTCSGV